MHVKRGAHYPKGIVIPHSIQINMVKLTHFEDYDIFNNVMIYGKWKHLNYEFQLNGTFATLPSFYFAENLYFSFLTDYPDIAGFTWEDYLENTNSSAARLMHFKYVSYIFNTICYTP